jgi:hypothetical protein
MTETLRRADSGLPEATHAKLLGLAMQAASSREGAEAARASLHKEIRRAHKAGGSIRAIAIAAGLSSTRVGVIVQDNGGTT